jgi:hypothetical protein
MMSHQRAFFLALAYLAILPLSAQSVISVRSGVIHFSEGAVFLDNQPLEHRFGRFEQMKDGSEIRTQDGRAEVILTPGVFLRLGRNSAIRLISGRLADTQLEFVSGSAVLDSIAATGNVPVTILYGGYQVRAQKLARCRFNSSPPELKVESGEAEVLLLGDSERVNAGELAPLTGQLVTRQFANQPNDPLDNWNTTRNDSISESNLATTTAPDLSTVVDGWENDPDAVIRSLLSNYAPLPSVQRSVSGYGTLPNSTYPLSTYSPLSTYGQPYGIWGLGYGSPLRIYAPPIVSYYPYPALGVGGYRPPLTSIRPGIGASPVYQPPRPAPITPIHSAPGGIRHR